MKIVFAVEAENDLTRIADYIAQNSPDRAMTFARALIRSVETLARSPKRFPLIPRYAHAGIRRQTFRNYLIFYRIDHDCISILRILHGARDYEPLLFGED